MPLMYAPPEFRPQAAGLPVGFADLCRLAGVACRITGRAPRVCMHGEGVDFCAVAPGVAVYCLARPLLFGAPADRACQALDKLAYQFFDWASREVLAQHRRVLQAANPHGAVLRRALAPTPLAVLAYVHRVPGCRPADVAKVLHIAQPHVSRAQASLVAADLAVVQQTGQSQALFATPFGQTLLAACGGPHAEVGATAQGQVIHSL